MEVVLLLPVARASDDAGVRSTFKTTLLGEGFADGELGKPVKVEFLGTAVGDELVPATKDWEVPGSSRSLSAMLKCIGRIRSSARSS